MSRSKKTCLPGQDAAQSRGDALVATLRANRARLEAYVTRVFRLDAEDARDVVSDAFLSLWKRRVRLPSGRVALLLQDAVRKRAIRFRKEAARRNRDIQPESLVGTGGPAYDVAVAELRRALRAEFEKLTGPQREACAPELGFAPRISNETKTVQNRRSEGMAILRAALSPMLNPERAEGVRRARQAGRQGGSRQTRLPDDDDEPRK